MNVLGDYWNWPVCPFVFVCLSACVQNTGNFVSPTATDLQLIPVVQRSSPFNIGNFC